MIHTKTGDEVNIHSGNDEDVRFKNLLNNLEFKIVKKYNGINEYNTLKLMVSNDNEGFVVRFENGFRMKIKGEEYCRLHRILTNISNRNIWEYLKNDKPLDEILDKVPDEFYNWVRETVIDLENKFEEIMAQVITDYWEITSLLITEEQALGEDMVYYEREYAKRYAEEAFKKKYPHLLFSYRKEIISPSNTTEAIWNMLFPDYVKPFKKNEDEKIIS
jgi:RNA ligase